MRYQVQDLLSFRQFVESFAIELKYYFCVNMNYTNQLNYCFFYLEIGPGDSVTALIDERI